MFNLNPEAKVGLFVFAGIVLLIYMSMWLGGVKLGKEDGILIYINFPNAAGLDMGASVAVAGVEVGRVESITLEANKAKLGIRVNPNVEVGRDFTAVLKNQGLLGEKYVELKPGALGAEPLKEGEELTRVATFTDIDKLVTVLADVATDIKVVTESLKMSMGGEGGANSLQNIIVSIETLMKELNNIVGYNSERFNSIMGNLDVMVADVRRDGPGLLKSFQEVSDNLNNVIVENRGGLAEGIENLRFASRRMEEAMINLDRLTQEIGPEITNTAKSFGKIAQKIERGEGTIGKLINDTETHDKLTATLSGVNKFLQKGEALKMHLGYRGEFLFDPGETKNYLSLKLIPSKDKYYLLEIIDDPRGERRLKTVDTTVGGVTTSEEILTTEDKMLFSIQVAKKMKWLTLRGGLIESTGGVGLDYHLFKERLVISLNAFDFDKARNPHLKVGGTLFLGKHFTLTAGYDDFISRVGLDSAYVGLGFHFEDEDLKYILGSVPSFSF